MTVVLVVAASREAESIMRSIAGRRRTPEATDGTLGEFFLRCDDVVIRIVLAPTPNPSIGGDPALLVTVKLAAEFQPFCVAMVGMCAGPEDRVTVKDVVVARATYRHDFGNLSKQDANAREFSFKPRGGTEQLKTHVADSILALVQKRNHRRGDAKSAFRTHLGVITTGNQIVRVPGIFDELQNERIDQLPGDENCRNLVALDMEAHAFAFAAANCQIPCWLVVKGVADYARHPKVKTHQRKATANAWTVLEEILRDVIVKEFLRQKEAKGRRYEERAVVAYRRGDIRGAAAAAALAHKLGRRSRQTRRRFLAGLRQRGAYATARRFVDRYRIIDGLYDDVTREAEAMLLWRAREYEKACDAVPTRVIGPRDRQLMYVRAMSEVFAGEPWGASVVGASAGENAHLRRALRLLKKATDVRIGKPAWWIWVNYYLIQRMLGASDADAQVSFDSALVSLQEVRRNPAAKMYRLLLLAIADDRAGFAKLIQQRNTRNEQISMDAFDGISAKLSMLRRRNILSTDAADYYLRAMYDWAGTADVHGKPQDRLHEILQSQP